MNVAHVLQEENHMPYVRVKVSAVCKSSCTNFSSSDVRITALADDFCQPKKNIKCVISIPTSARAVDKRFERLRLLTHLYGLQLPPLSPWRSERRSLGFRSGGRPHPWSCRALGLQSHEHRR